MAATVAQNYDSFLQAQSDADWQTALDELLPSVHEVDRNATRIWFHFFPLSLARAFEQTDDADTLARKLLMQGKFRLKDQIDSSHKFLYGHRFWSEVKRAVARHAEAGAASLAGRTLASEIRAVAERAAAEAKTDVSLIIGITAVAFMTLRQVGLEAFKAAPGEVRLDARSLKKSPEQILKERAKDDSQGILGFLRTVDKQWTITFNEQDETARVKAFNNEELASAAARDKREWHLRDERCTINEGPIPVQCRSASCGTCWVGVLGGAEKLSPVAAREAKNIKLFGYIDTDEARPLIRLACQAQTTGAVSIVIPPWNGVFGKYLRRLNEGAAGAETQAEN